VTATDVKVSEVIDAARRGRALLAPEIAGYLVLGAADQLARAPALLDEHRCGVLVEGGRVVLAPSPPSSAIDSERTLRDLLKRLLEAASGRAPALYAVANGPAKGNVAVLVAELESALIPVNRSAAGRALSRLARDAVRARSKRGDQPPESPKPPPAIDPLPAYEIEADDVVEADDAVAADDTERIQVLEGGTDVPQVIEDAELSDIHAARTSVAEPPSSRERTAGSSDVDDLLSARLSSGPPAAATPSAQSVANAGAAAAPASDAPVTAPSDPLLRPSHPSASSRGVDELIQDFMMTTSRKEARVAEDLRKMIGVEAPPAATPDPSPITLGGEPYESPFHNSSGAADFYTATPPLRTMVAQSVAPIPDEDPFARRSTRRKVYMMLGLLSFLTLGTVTLLRLEPGFLSGRTSEVVEAEKRAAAAEAASIAARGASAACRATLLVSDVPPGAEVLVRSGVAPVDVDRVPSGARLEFVALVDGYAPRRGIVPRGVEWDGKTGKPRFELPIQLEKSRTKSGALDAWPSTEPGSVVGGQGPTGTVHVVTSPRGAEVWMVAGGAPEAKIESLPCGTSVELLVAGSAQGQPFRRRLRVDASQLTPEASSLAVTGRISAR
jgi:hypothetical protein